MSDKKMTAAISEFIENFKESLGVDAKVLVTISEDKESGQLVVDVVFEGDKLGYMIGNQGKHLASLQFILSMMVNKKFAKKPEERVYVNVDVSGYKKQREDKIEALAMRLADDARILGEPLDMEPMPAAERRIVHMVLDKFDDIKTESFGEGFERAVRIIPTGEADLNIESFNKKVSEEEDEESEE